MDEESNNNEQNLAEKTNENIQEAQKAVKDSANLAKNAASGNYLGAIKNGISLLRNKKARRTALIAILIPIIVVVSLALSIYSIFNTIGDTIQEAIKNIQNLFTVDWDNGNGAIDISDEAIDQIIAAIESTGVDLEDLRLMGDVDYSTIDKESDEYKEVLRKYIRKFYEAQVTTETLNTNPGWFEEYLVNGGKTYGSVYLYRVQDVEEVDKNIAKSEQLKYMSYDKMAEKAEAGAAEEIKKYFSVKDNKLIIPEWTETTINDGDTTTTVTLREIDYKNLISQYTTPMNFFIYLAMISQNPEFVAAVSDLVKGSKIDLTILDTVTTSIENEDYTYTEHVKGSRVYYETDVDPITGAETSDKVVESVSETNHEEQKTKTEITTTIPTLKVTYVKTWFCEQEIKYRRGEPTINKDEYVLDASNDASMADDPEPAEPPEGSTVSWITDRRKDVNTSTTQTTYEESERGQVIDKTDDFIKLLDVKYKIPNTNRFEAAGKNNMISGAEWLFSLMQKDAGLQNLEQVMRYILGKYAHKDYGVSSLDFNIFNIRDFKNISGMGSISAFGNKMTREEFIAKAQAYNGGSSYSKLANIAGDFYDICTSYNVNPCLAFAWACIETGWGSSIPNNNLFGYAVYNGKNSGASYSKYADSIADFCKWVVNAGTQGTSAYNSAYTRAQEYAAVNPKFNGAPENNAYALFSTYMYLGNTHICDEPDFNNPAGKDYYTSHGSTWGAGGRIYIYMMYEKGGIATGEYKTRCGHSKGTDQTTIQERADYSQYSFETRANTANGIFGSHCFMGNSIVECAYMVAEHFMNSGVEVHYAGDSVNGATNNGRKVISGNIQSSWDSPIQNPDKYGVVCATFVSMAIWKAELIDEATINRYGYNACVGVESMLTQSTYAGQWEKITNFNELREGDIVFQPGHVYIYMEGGKCLDQNYCVVTSDGSRKSMGTLLNASANSFRVAYRYVGN